MTKLKNVPVGEVPEDFMDRVAKHQGKPFIRVGVFDTRLLREFVESLEEVDIYGEAELLVAPDNIMRDNSKAGLLVARTKYPERVVALAGLSDGVPQ